MSEQLGLDPYHDFPAWLTSRGMNHRMARALEMELGITDYDALLACARPMNVRFELLAVAKERLPFAAYAVLRQVLEGCPLEGGTSGESCSFRCSTSPHAAIAALLDAIVTTLSGLSQELFHSAQRFSCLYSGGQDSVEDVQADAGCNEDSTQLDTTQNSQQPWQMEREREDYKDGHLMEFPPSTECELPVETLPPHPSLRVKTEGLIGDVNPWEDGVEMEDDQGCSKSKQFQRTMKVEGTMHCADSVKDLVDGKHADGEESEEIHPSDWFPAEPPDTFCSAETVGGGHTADVRPCEVTSRVDGDGARQGEDWRKLALGSNLPPPLLPLQPPGFAGERGGFLCQWCGQGFSQKRYLQIHQRTHTGERPFACEDCGKRFRQSSDLVRHRRTHTGERPYRCPECDRWFRLKHHLRDHRRTHSGVKLAYE